MPRLIIDGEPGEAYANDGTKVVFQFLCNWHNSCGMCVSLDHKVGDYFPIPLHRGCNCKQKPILPGQLAEPFVDFRSKILTVSPSQQAAIMGRSNLAMVESGLVEWSDVVTPSRIRSLREVASRKRLTVDQMVGSGVTRGRAEEAWQAVHTGAHTASEKRRADQVKALLGKGYTGQQVIDAAGRAVGSRVGIVEGPSGPGMIAYTPKPTPRPVPKVQARSAALKPSAPLPPLKPATEIPSHPAGPTVTAQTAIGGRLAKYAEGDRVVARLAAIGDELSAAEAKFQAAREEGNTLVGRIGNREPTEAEKASYASVAEKVRSARDARDAISEGQRGRALEALTVADPLDIKFRAGPTVTGFGDLTAPSADIKAEIAKAHEWLVKVVAKKPGEGEYAINVGRIKKGSEQREYYAEDGRAIATIAKTKADTIVHEFGHSLEGHLNAGPKGYRLKVLSREFLEHRVGDEPMTKLADAFPDHGYTRDEMGRKDHFDRIFDGSQAYYVGKDYGRQATEVMSMGMEALYRDPVGFATRDPEYCKFVVGVLRGDLR